MSLRSVWQVRGLSGVDETPDSPCCSGEHDCSTETMAGNKAYLSGGSGSVALAGVGWPLAVVRSDRWAGRRPDPGDIWLIADALTRDL